MFTSMRRCGRKGCRGRSAPPALLASVLLAVALPTGAVLAPAPPADAASATGSPSPENCPFPADALVASGDPNSSYDLVRRDGRIDHFLVASPSGTQVYSVWYRPQRTPGGAYDCWTRINAEEVRPKAGKRYVLPIEDVDGRIEVFYDTIGMWTNRIYQNVADGPWLEENFSAASPPYWGNPVVVPLPDGRYGFVQVSQHDADHQRGVWYVAQSAPAGPWGQWIYLGPGPFRSGLAYLSPVVSPVDGTVHIIGTMWSAPEECIAYADQLPNGDWSSWRPDPASPAFCT